MCIKTNIQTDNPASKLRASVCVCARHANMYTYLHTWIDVYMHIHAHTYDTHDTTLFGAHLHTHTHLYTHIHRTPIWGGKRPLVTAVATSFFKKKTDDTDLGGSRLSSGGSNLEPLNGGVASAKKRLGT